MTQVRETVGKASSVISEHHAAHQPLCDPRLTQTDAGQAWQNYIETQFNVMRRMADYHSARATASVGVPQQEPGPQTLRSDAPKG